MATQSAACQPSVQYVAGRYPFRPTCTCGWKDWGYVADHAAQMMVDAHLAGRV